MTGILAALLLRIKLLLLACIFLVLPLQAILAQSIKIGVSVPLSGEGAALGNDIKNSLLYANQSLAQGKYHFIFEDERTTKDAVAIAHKFIEIDKVRYVIGPTVNSTVLAAGPIYERAAVTCISPVGSTGDKSGIGKHIFRIYPADQLSAEKLAPFVYDRYEKIGLVSDQDEYTALIERTLIRINKSRPVPRQLYAEQASAGDTDYRALFLKLKAKGIEALILNPMIEASFIRMMKQRASLKLNVPVFTFVLPSAKVVQDALGKSLDGVVYANLPSISQLGKGKGQLLLEQFTERFGEPKSVPLVVALAYEAFRILDLSISSGQAAHEFLSKLKVEDSVIGPYNFDADGAVQGLDFILEKYESTQLKDK